MLPRPGIIQSSCEPSGFEPGTFRSSVWRSPNWAISAIYWWVWVDLSSKPFLRSTFPLSFSGHEGGSMGFFRVNTSQVWLSINYVAINKDLEKLPPQLYSITMKIFYDQGYDYIGVVMATKWRHYLFFLKPSISRLYEFFFQHRLRVLFLPTVASMFVMFKRNLLERYRDILGWRFLRSEISTVKTGQSWCSAVIRRKRSAFETPFHLLVVSIFLKTCVEDNGDSFSRLQERRFDYYVLRRSY